MKCMRVTLISTPSWGKVTGLKVSKTWVTYVELHFSQSYLCQGRNLHPKI